MNFAFVKKQFTFAERLVVPRAAGHVLGDMSVDEERAAGLEVHVGVANVGLAFAQGLHFGAVKHESRFYLFEDVVVVRGGAILRDDFFARLLGILGLLEALPRFTSWLGHNLSFYLMMRLIRVSGTAAHPSGLVPATGHPLEERLRNWQMGPFEEHHLENPPACRVRKADARLHEIVKTRLALRRDSGEYMSRWCKFVVLFAVAVFAAGCPKAKKEYNAGRHAVDLKDYDAAVDYYLKAAKADPHNVSYKIGLDQARFEAGASHVQKGLKLREKGDFQGAVSEFQHAQIMDPSSTAADQELKRTLQMIGEQVQANQPPEQPLMENGQPGLASAPPELKPLSRAPINLRMSNDIKVVFDTIGKLAGLTVIYDPDLQARRKRLQLRRRG